MPEPSIDRLVKDTKRVLHGNFWIPALHADVTYGRIHDDHDGTNEGILLVSFDRMGDAFISIQSRSRGKGSDLYRFSDALRFRTSGGGGLSLRTRNALMILAEAIRLDNEDRPAADPSKNRPNQEHE